MPGWVLEGRVLGLGRSQAADCIFWDRPEREAELGYSGRGGGGNRMKPQVQLNSTRGTRKA